MSFLANWKAALVAAIESPREQALTINIVLIRSKEHMFRLSLPGENTNDHVE